MCFGSELVRRTIWIGNSLQPGDRAGAGRGQGFPTSPYPRLMLRSQGEALGVAVYDARGGLVIADGPADLFKSLPSGARQSRPSRRARMRARSDRAGDVRWLEQAIPLHVNGAAGRCAGDSRGRRVYQFRSYRRVAAELLAHPRVCVADRGCNVPDGALVPDAAHHPPRRAPAAVAHGSRRRRNGSEFSGPQPLLARWRGKWQPSPRACSRRAPPRQPKPACARPVKTSGPPNGWPCTCAKSLARAVSLSYPIANPTCIPRRARRWCA